MKISCVKHGEVEGAPPTKDGRVYCSECLSEAEAAAVKELGADSASRVIVDGKLVGISIGSVCELRDGVLHPQDPVPRSAK